MNTADKKLEEILNRLEQIEVRLQMAEFTIWQLNEPKRREMKELDKEINSTIVEKDENPSLKEVIEFAKELDSISASRIQKKFNIGFGRSGRFLEKLEKKGIIDIERGPGPRKVLKKR